MKRSQKILDVMERETKKAMRSTETARQKLIDEGIYTENDELSPEFGGPPVKEASKT